MVTEGPESLVEFNRDSKEVRLDFLQFGVVLERYPHRAQGRLRYCGEEQSTRAGPTWAPSRVTGF